VEKTFKLLALKTIVPLGLLLAITLLGYKSYTQDVVPLIPLPVIFKYPEKTNLSLSPSGTHIAYCAPVNGTMNIWVKTLGLNNDIVLTNSEYGVSYYRWLTNRKIIYYEDTYGDISDYVWIIDVVTGQIDNLTPNQKIKVWQIEDNFPLFTNSAITNRILLLVDQENTTVHDVYQLDLETREFSLVAKNPGNIIAWIPDATLSVRGALQINEDGSQTLSVREKASMDWRPLLEFEFENLIKDELYNGLLGFSANGNFLYLNSALDTDTRSLLKVDIANGSRTILATDPEYDIDSVTIVDDKTMIVRWQKQRAETVLLSDDLSLKQDFEKMKAISNGALRMSNGRYSQDLQKWILGFEYDNQSFEFYLYDRSTQRALFLFDWLPEINKYPLAKMHPIKFDARDGLKIEGYITYPLYQERQSLPLVLLVHGGPFMRDEWGYFAVVQFLANRGYACLQVNYRGSSGYGKKFLNAGNKEWGGKMQDDLVDAVQWAIREGIADPKRIAIFGISYGGYAALIGATSTPDLFSCAIDYCGPSSLITVMQNLPSYWSLAQWEKRIGSLQDEEFLKSRSPLSKIDQLKIPIFIAHGSKDVRVKQSESEQVVCALKEKCIEHEYLLMANEGHGFLSSKSRLELYKGIEVFLAKHLGGRSEE